VKLPIKKKYFDLIREGKKTIEYRDAHITFICEETGEKLVCDITDVALQVGVRDLYPDVLEDDWTLCMEIKITEDSK
jgi:ASC-1-like (ASCH) protein